MLALQFQLYMVNEMQEKWSLDEGLFEQLLAHYPLLKHVERVVERLTEQQDEATSYVDEDGGS